VNSQVIITFVINGELRRKEQFLVSHNIDGLYYDIYHHNETCPQWINILDNILVIGMGRHKKTNFINAVKNWKMPNEKWFLHARQFEEGDFFEEVVR